MVLEGQGWPWSNVSTQSWPNWTFGSPFGSLQIQNRAKNDKVTALCVGIVNRPKITMIATNDVALSSSQVAKRIPEPWFGPIFAQINSWQAIWVFTDSKSGLKRQRYSPLCVKAQSTQSHYDCHQWRSFDEFPGCKEDTWDMTWPYLGSNQLLASHLGLYRFKIGPKTTEIQPFVCESSIDSKGYEWVNCTAWEPHLHCSNWVKSHIFEWNVYFSVHMVEKIKNLSIDFIWLNNDQNRCQKWPFSLISPSISDFVLKILKPCKGNQIKFIFFLVIRHRTTFPSQEIWNLTQNEAVKGWVHI